MRLLILTLFTVSIIFVSGCKKDNNDPEPGIETSIPEIVSLSSDKSSIEFGGEDPAIITCNASGGDISFEWEVDLGDIFVLNETGSQVRFTGSECCIGEKIITCTVKNDKGSTSETVMINIFIP
jgi:hypothetical protein